MERLTHLGAVKAAVVGIAALAISGCASTGNGDPNDPLNLAAETSGFNATLPVMVDADTRLDSTWGYGDALRYNYTLVNHTLADLNVKLFNETMGPVIKNSVCSSPDMEVFIDNGVTVSYIYRDSEGREAGRFVVTPADCGR